MFWVHSTWEYAWERTDGAEADGSAPAQSWLLRTGWKHWGLIDPAEVPGPRERGPG